MQSFTTLIMVDGSEVNLTLNYLALYKLRANSDYSDTYTRFMTIQMDGASDELDIVFVLYVAYLCANVDDLKSCMSVEEFLGLLQPSRAVLTRTYSLLLFPKEVKASAERS